MLSTTIVGEPHQVNGHLFSSLPTTYLNPAYQNSAALKFFNRVFPPTRQQNVAIPEPQSHALPKHRLPRIPKKTAKLLDGPIEGYQSPQHQDFAIAVSLANSHHTFEQILTIMNERPGAGWFRKTYRYTKRKALYWLTQAVEKAGKRDSEATEDFIAELDALQGLLRFVEFENKATADTNRQVLRALFDVGKTARRPEFRIDHRTLAQIALVSRRTAGNAIKVLSKQNFLSIHGWTKQAGTLIKLELDNISANARESIAYQSQLFPSNHATSYGGYWSNSETKGETTAENSSYGYWGKSETENQNIIIHVDNPIWKRELFVPKRFGKGSKKARARAHGLGRACGWIYQLLVTPLSFEELRKACEKSRATIYRCLAKMSEIVDPTGEIHSIVEQGEDGLWRRTDADLDEISKAVGTEGKRRRMKIVHDIERRQYRGVD